jgi:hypothetical protein
MIKAEIILDSVTESGNRITTFELEYPRFIHGELMTHRVFSRNAASSRAIPIDKMIELVKYDPATPVHWGSNQPGMQADYEIDEVPTAIWAWRRSARRAVESARELQALGLHKQIVNRVLEPFQTMKTVVTATEFENFFNLRCHADAQPEIRALACLMRRRMDASKPKGLLHGEWHLPYTGREFCRDSEVVYMLDGKPIPLDVAKRVSASCCAQVSYRVLDTGIEKATKIFDSLVNSTPIHASPFEHQATPDEGAVNNFKGWRQYRQDIEQEKRGQQCQ